MALALSAAVRDDAITDTHTTFRRPQLPATLDQSCNQGTLASNAIVASLQGVNKNYGHIRALRDVDFRVRAGEVVALLGPNGAGKTTAVKLLLGLLQPTSAKARFFGGDPTNPENRMRTGAMLQVGRVPETLRVREHIDLFSTYYQPPMRRKTSSLPRRPRGSRELRVVICRDFSKRGICGGHRDRLVYET
jgi:ABC-type Mn2+/Zn2+ transport system ATPase subunit